MKGLVFLGSSLDDLRAMPAGIRHVVGVELMRVQFGGDPSVQASTRFVSAKPLVRSG